MEETKYILQRVKSDQYNGQDVIADRAEQYRRNCLANQNKDLTKIKKIKEEKKNRVEYIVENIPTF